MKSFTFEVLKRDPKQDYLYDIFAKSVSDNMTINNALKGVTVVLEGEEGRLDILSKRVFGSSQYVEELMVLNNIMNPFSIEVGDVIYVVEQGTLTMMQQVDKTTDNSEQIAKPKNKSTRVDPSRNTGVPPTIRPVDFEQMLVDRKNQTIKLNTKLS